MDQAENLGRNKFMQKVDLAAYHRGIGRKAPYRDNRRHRRKDRQKSVERNACGDQVKFGATVTVVDEDTEEERTYQIVGEHEADVKQGKISIASPIARA